MTLVIDFSPLIIAQEMHMLDVCTIKHFSGYVYSGIDSTKVYTTTDSICGVKFTKGPEVINGVLVITELDAELRLPVDTNLSAKDEITISGVDYNVASVYTGKTCMLAGLTLIEA